MSPRSTHDRGLVMSPPTRAEWIEMGFALGVYHTNFLSPPTRAEWIEIHKRKYLCYLGNVSAHTGGVD